MEKKQLAIGNIKSGYIGIIQPQRTQRKQRKQRKRREFIMPMLPDLI
jgi:hypothetical protein